jgi:drug/metabolite transporter (DMT)-like permease
VVLALALSAGLGFGLLNVAVRWGIGKNGAPGVAALIATSVAACVSAVGAAPTLLTHPGSLSKLWIYIVVGALAPGLSQILLTYAVDNAGSSRAAVVMGSAPLVSVAIAVAFFHERFSVLVAAGTLLIVSAVVVLTGADRRVAGYRRLGLVAAFAAALTFAVRDNIIRWGAHGTPPPPLVAATVMLGSGAICIGAFVFARQGSTAVRHIQRSFRLFVPAGLALAVGYDALLLALDRGRVSIVSPVSATGVLWSVAGAAIVFRRTEHVGPRTAVAALLVVGGGALIGTVR